MDELFKHKNELIWEASHLYDPLHSSSPSLDQKSSKIISQATNASSLCEMNIQTDVCAALMKPTEPDKNNRDTGETRMKRE